jgi:hypothetical protein
MLTRLDYERHVAQGSDRGAITAEVLQRQAPEGLLGIHINALYTPPPEIARAFALNEPAPATLSAKEMAAYEQLKARGVSCYFVGQATRPQTTYGRDQCGGRSAVGRDASLPGATMVADGRCNWHTIPDANGWRRPLTRHRPAPRVGSGAKDHQVRE